MTTGKPESQFPNSPAHTASSSLSASPNTSRLLRPRERGGLQVHKKEERPRPHSVVRYLPSREIQAPIHFLPQNMPLQSPRVPPARPGHQIIVVREVQPESQTVATTSTATGPSPPSFSTPPPPRMPSGLIGNLNQAVRSTLPSPIKPNPQPSPGLNSQSARHLTPLLTSVSPGLLANLQTVMNFSSFSSPPHEPEPLAILSSSLTALSLETLQGQIKRAMESPGIVPPTTTPMLPPSSRLSHNPSALLHSLPQSPNSMGSGSNTFPQPSPPATPLKAVAENVQSRWFVINISELANSTNPIIVSLKNNGWVLLRSAGGNIFIDLARTLRINDEKYSGPPTKEDLLNFIHSKFPDVPEPEIETFFATYHQGLVGVQLAVLNVASAQYTFEKNKSSPFSFESSLYSCDKHLRLGSRCYSLTCRSKDNPEKEVTASHLWIASLFEFKAGRPVLVALGTNSEAFREACFIAATDPEHPTNLDQKVKSLFDAEEKVPTSPVPPTPPTPLYSWPLTF